MATIKKYGKIELSKSEIKFLKDNFQNMTNRELASYLGLKLTKTRIIVIDYLKAKLKSFE